ncbi:hypothetical protein OIDMADRAFT_136550, partial [Oidiodendron maius Zn]
DPSLTVRYAAKIYNVCYTILLRWCSSQQLRCDILPKSRKLTDSEEKAIVQYILYIDSKGFPI